MATPFVDHRPKKLAAKVIILGEPGVGKTCLFQRIKYKQFKGNSVGTDASTDGPTFPMSRSGLNKGLDSYVHSVILNPDQHVALTLYDSIYPQGRGKSLSANFFKRVQAVILLCSVDNENSLLRLRYWLDEAKHYIKDPHPVFIVVATKCDLDRNIEITDESLQNFGAYNDLPTFQVSAKTNSGIHAMLRELASRFVDQQARSGHISLTPLKSNEQQRLLDPSCNVGEDEPLTVRDFDNGSCFSSCCTIL